MTNIETLRDLSQRLNELPAYGTRVHLVPSHPTSPITLLTDEGDRALTVHDVLELVDGGEPSVTGYVWVRLVHDSTGKELGPPFQISSAYVEILPWHRQPAEIQAIVEARETQPVPVPGAASYGVGDLAVVVNDALTPLEIGDLVKVFRVVGGTRPAAMWVVQIDNASDQGIIGNEIPVSSDNLRPYVAGEDGPPAHPWGKIVNHLDGTTPLVTDAELLPHDVRWAKAVMDRAEVNWSTVTEHDSQVTYAALLHAESGGLLTRAASLELFVKLRAMLPDGPDRMEVARAIWDDHRERTNYHLDEDDTKCVACRMAGALGWVDKSPDADD